MAKEWCPSAVPPAATSATVSDNPSQCPRMRASPDVLSFGAAGKAAGASLDCIARVRQFEAPSAEVRHASAAGHVRQINLAWRQPYDPSGAAPRKINWPFRVLYPIGVSGLGQRTLPVTAGCSAVPVSV